MHPIRRVAVVSTGTVKIHPEHLARSWVPLPWWLLTSRRWTEPLPINVYVIEHDAGLVLFDTGQNRASVTDRGYFPRGLLGVLYSRLARFTISAEETLSAQLAGLGYDIADVQIAVVSHLHQDHIGGLTQLGRADIVVAAAEIAAARGRFARLNGYLKRHIFIPKLRWKPIEGKLDLFDDGSITVLPTPGHTPGSLSMLICQPGIAPLLFVGDLTYDVALLAKGQVPGVGARRELVRSTRLVAELSAQHPGLVVLAAHDSSAKERLSAATSERSVAK